MKITAIEPILLAIPFRHDGPQTGFAGQTWSRLEYLLVRVETDAGLVGYGEAYGYGAIPGTRAILERTVAPLAIGRSADDIAGTMEALRRPLHVFGRSGPVQYALSGLDLALWDLAGKKAGLPLWRLLGGSPRAAVPAYASKLPLSEPRHVAHACARAIERGFRAIKLHETTVEATAAAREAIGPESALMLDVNCPWSFAEALARGRALEPYDLPWLEEPLWPPDDLENLGRLGRLLTMPLAAGENAANAWAFKDLARLDRLDILQPSITKCGGVSEFIQIGMLAGLNNRTLVPHSPYFGPGYLATLQMAAAFPRIPWIEHLSVELEQPIFDDVGLPTATGEIAIPQGPGLGADPNPAVLSRYRV